MDTRCENGFRIDPTTKTCVRKRCPVGTRRQSRTGICVKKGELRCPDGTRKRRLLKNEPHDIYRECLPYRQRRRKLQSLKKQDEIRGISPLSNYRMNSSRGNVSPVPVKKGKGILHKLMKMTRLTRK